MTSSFERDPLDELRSANPVDADRLPPASAARIRARVQEATTMEVNRQVPRARRLGLRAWGAGLGMGAVAIVLAAIVLGRGGAPGITPGPTTGPGMASCVEPYTLDTLKHRSFAFDGTVTAVSGDEVTFTVNERYIGSGNGSVTLTAMGMTGASITSAGGPNLTVGARYLVAGDDHFVWACGYTQPYDAGVAAQWKQASGG